MAYVATTLRPGFLVSLKTSITGNVKYKKETIEAATLNVETGEQKAKWETERTVRNAAEQEAAAKVRNKARSLISGPCSLSEFGLLCPDGRKDELDGIIAEARELAVEFNKTATTTHIAINVLTGKIAPDDAMAIKAINSEVTDLLDTMKAGLEKLDVKAIREAAGRAKQLGQMLNMDAQVKIQFAVDAVRKTAKKIAEAGEQTSIAVDKQTLQTLAEARTAFLDLDQAGEIGAPAAQARTVDLQSQ